MFRWKHDSPPTTLEAASLFISSSCSAILGIGRGQRHITIQSNHFCNVTLTVHAKYPELFFLSPAFFLLIAIPSKLLSIGQRCSLTSTGLFIEWPMSFVDNLVFLALSKKASRFEWLLNCTMMLEQEGWFLVLALWQTSMSLAVIGSFRTEFIWQSIACSFSLLPSIPLISTLRCLEYCSEFVILVSWSFSCFIHLHFCFRARFSLWRTWF